MNIRRLNQVIKYGWKDSKSISESSNGDYSRLKIFKDILGCFIKYNVWSNQYKKEKIYQLSNEERKKVCLKFQKENNYRDNWVKEFFANYKFLNKWSKFKYECNASLQVKRRKAYKKQYGLGDNCFIGYNVIFHKHHYVNAKITTGKDCLIAENCNIDYTGGITLGNKVAISEGVKIITHDHNQNRASDDITKGNINSPLIVEDNVWIGSQSMILAGTKKIGRYAIIGAGTTIRSQIPPYAIVIGNPAKIIGFILSPDEVISFENNKNNTTLKTDIDIYQTKYEKYYKSRIKEIKNLISL